MTSAQTSKETKGSIMVFRCPFALHSKFSAKSFVSPKYAHAGTTLSMQKLQPQLPGTSAHSPVQHKYLQQKEPYLVLPGISWLAWEGRGSSRDLLIQHLLNPSQVTDIDEIARKDKTGWFCCIIYVCNAQT